MNDSSKLNGDHVANSTLIQQQQQANFKSAMIASKATSVNPAPSANANSFASASVSHSIVDAKKKKARLVPPSIRLELTIEPPDSQKFTEYNYNKLILKTFKFFKKQSKKEKKAAVVAASTGSASTSDECVLRKRDLPMLESDISVKKESIGELLSMYRKKIILSKELDDDERINGHDDELHALDDDQLDEEENNSQSCDVDDDMEGGGGGGGGAGGSGGAELLSSKKTTSRKKCARSLYESDNNRYKLRDFAHLGKGYDENDSFIDNSDAVDVHVPSNMAPKRGGFYINKEAIKLEKIKGKRRKRKSKIRLYFRAERKILALFTR